MLEKRKFPRLNKTLPIKLSDQEFDILTETKNISANGAYCTINKPLAEMTKLNVILLLPVKKKKAQVIKKINCSGVVVRQDQVTDDHKCPYRIGIYFNNIAETDQKTLRSYVTASLRNR